MLWMGIGMLIIGAFFTVCLANAGVIDAWDGTQDGGSVRRLARACDRVRALRGRPAHRLAAEPVRVPAVVIDDDPDPRLARVLLTWLTAMLVWRYGHIEEKWSARLPLTTPQGDGPRAS